jgi:prophage regulatory protein
MTPEPANNPTPTISTRIVSPQILRLQDVQTSTGLSRSGIYERMAAGTFPQSVGLGGRCVGWVQSEVTAWIESRIATRQQSMTKRDHFLRLK